MVDGFDRIDREGFAFNRLDDVVPEHEMLDVARRNQNPLSAGKPPALAGVEKPFDFLVHPADGLNSAQIVDRSGNRQGLFERNLGYGG